MKRKRVLVVEDEARIRRFLRSSLEDADFRVEETALGQTALSLAGSQPPDIVLLDLGLPDMDGLEVLKRIREWSPVPVIIISARGQEADKIAGLDAGADDYLTKPFAVGELLARVRVALRHAARKGDEAPALYEVTGLKVDLALRRVWAAGAEVHLSPIQYKVLSVLVRNAGKVVTHKQLLREAWGEDSEAGPESVRIFVHQLRHKIEPNPVRPKFLKNEPGVGYRLLAED